MNLGSLARRALVSRALLASSVLVSTLFQQRSARAEPEVPPDFPRLVLDTGRPAISPPESDLVRFQIHGEYQIRYEHLRSFPLDPTLSVAQRSGATSDSLGQNDFATHWLRVTPRLQIKDNIEIVGQM